MAAAISNGAGAPAPDSRGEQPASGERLFLALGGQRAEHAHSAQAQPRAGQRAQTQEAAATGAGGHKGVHGLNLQLASASGTAIQAAMAEPSSQGWAKAGGTIAARPNTRRMSSSENTFRMRKMSAGLSSSR